MGTLKLLLKENILNILAIFCKKFWICKNLKMRKFIKHWKMQKFEKKMQMIYFLKKSQDNKIFKYTLKHVIID